MIPMLPIQKGKIRKKFRLLCLLVALCLFFPSILIGCKKEPEYTSLLESFYTSLVQGNYGKAYSLLAFPVREEISLTDFSNKYQSIFSAMQTDKNQPFTYCVEPMEDLTYHVTLKYDSLLFGGFVQETMVALVKDLDHALRIAWTPACIFTDLDWEETVQLRTLHAKRGEILGQDATPYAINAYADTVYIHLDKIKDFSKEQFTLLMHNLSFLCDMKVSEIEKILLSERSLKDRIALIKSYWPGEMDTSIKEELKKLTGVGIDNSQYTPIRTYPQKKALSHLIGYATGLTKEDLAQKSNEDLSPSALLGRSGLEYAYENELRGQNGYALSIYKKNGERKKNIITIPAKDGLDLCLTIDADLQYRAESLLDTLPENAGAVILTMDPIEGAITSIGCNPRYDPNTFSRGMQKETYEALLKEEANRPLFNRATQGLYPPGSTLKPLMAAMALQNGILRAEDAFTEKIENRQWTPKSNWSYGPITRVQDYPGPVNMENAIIYSDNIYFANLSLKSGWDMVENFLRSLGFMNAFSFDTGTATSSIYNNEGNKSLRLLADSGYGQGELLITPLQMASLYTAFLNNGDILTPYVVSSLNRMDGMQYKKVYTHKRSIYQENALKEDAITQLLPMMQGVVTKGSAKSIQIGDLKIYAKTGTAEIGNDKTKEIAWIIAFVKEPYARLVCIMAEVKAGEGGFRYALAKEMLQP